MEFRTARRISLILGLLIGVLILAETLINAVSLAPSFGETVPSWLAWAGNIPLIESLYVDSLVSIVFIVWIAFQFAERDTLDHPPRRMRSSGRGSAAGGAILLFLAFVLGGAFLYAVFGLNVGDIGSNFLHFLGGL
ncbi:MAG TPA: hypothetical protein VGU43_04560 [Thermoplasmata archaeon]|nr:hypothetical protein [Thermoplasmata archaeon]